MHAPLETFGCHVFGRFGTFEHMYLSVSVSVPGAGDLRVETHSVWAIQDGHDPVIILNDPYDFSQTTIG